jgi:glutamate-1-semialdehyde 2,1-aminomutase
LAAQAGIPASVDGLGTVFQLWFSAEPIHSWRDAARCADEARFTRWWQEMFKRGVLFHPLQFENLFVSLVHTDEDVDVTLAAAAEAFEVLGREARGS